MYPAGHSCVDCVACDPAGLYDLLACIAPYHRSCSLGSGLDGSLQISLHGLVDRVGANKSSLLDSLAGASTDELSNTACACLDHAVYVPSGSGPVGIVHHSSSLQHLLASVASNALRHSCRDSVESAADIP